jgi:hypothetical protein
MAKRSSDNQSEARPAPVDAPTDTDFDATLAKMIALAARDGVEDLHADGAFSDQQAPSLNRRLRGQVYELLIATRHRDPGRRHDPFAEYVHDLAHGHRGGLATAALQGAIARAVVDFAAAEAVDGDTARKLREAAVKAALVAYKTVDRLNRSKPKNERDRRAAEYWLMRVPSYWEEPVVSPEFQKLLNRSAHDRPAS